MPPCRDGRRTSDGFNKVLSGATGGLVIAASVEGEHRDTKGEQLSCTNKAHGVFICPPNEPDLPGPRADSDPVPLCRRLCQKQTDDTRQQTNGSNVHVPRSSLWVLTTREPSEMPGAASSCCEFSTNWASTLTTKAGINQCHKTRTLASASLWQLTFIGRIFKSFL